MHPDELLVFIAQYHWKTQPCNMMNLRKCHWCLCKIRKLQYISCSVLEVLLWPPQGFHVVNGLKMNSSQASICRAQIHYQMHSLSHHLPSGYRHDYRAMLSDARGSRWAVEVNVYNPTLPPSLRPSGHTSPLSHKSSLSLSWPPLSTLRRRGNLEA